MHEKLTIIEASVLVNKIIFRSKIQWMIWTILHFC